MNYSNVVSRDTFPIRFIVADLNTLDVLAGDIQNAFLEFRTKDNIFFYSGDEWKSDKEKVVIVVRALMVSNLQLCSSLIAWLKP